jgi:hypothetical protein
MIYSVSVSGITGLNSLARSSLEVRRGFSSSSSSIETDLSQLLCTYIHSCVVLVVLSIYYPIGEMDWMRCWGLLLRSTV